MFIIKSELLVNLTRSIRLQVIIGLMNDEWLSFGNPIQLSLCNFTPGPNKCIIWPV